MNCPLCNQPLVEEYPDLFVCQKKLSLGSQIVSHYSHKISIATNGAAILDHFMLVPPYKIVTFEGEFSKISKLNNNGGYSFIMNTYPILPTLEKNLINKISTLIIFS